MTYIFNVSKVVAKYINPLSKYEFSNTDTLSFLESLKNSKNLMKIVLTTLKVCLQVFLSKKQ